MEDVHLFLAVNDPDYVADNPRERQELLSEVTVETALEQSRRHLRERDVIGRFRHQQDQLQRGGPQQPFFLLPVRPKHLIGIGPQSPVSPYNQQLVNLRQSIESIELVEDSQSFQAALDALMQSINANSDGREPLNASKQALLTQPERIRLTESCFHVLYEGRALEIYKALIDNRLLSQQEDINGLLHYSARQGWTWAVAMLLQKGADVSSEGNYALRYACFLKRGVELAQLLLDNGADVVGTQGEPLTVAIDNQDIPLIELFFRHIQLFKQGQLPLPKQPANSRNTWTTETYIRVLDGLMQMAFKRCCRKADTTIMRVFLRLPSQVFNPGWDLNELWKSLALEDPKSALALRVLLEDERTSHPIPNDFALNFSDNKPLMALFYGYQHSLNEYRNDVTVSRIFGWWFSRQIQVLSANGGLDVIMTEVPEYEMPTRRGALGRAAVGRRRRFQTVNASYEQILHLLPFFYRRFLRIVNNLQMQFTAKYYRPHAGGYRQAQLNFNSLSGRQ